MFPGSLSPEALRDQGPSKVTHIHACLLGSVTPQTNTEGLSALPLGAKSVHRRKGEAATVGLSHVCKGPPEHSDPANLPFPQRCVLFMQVEPHFMRYRAELRGGPSSSDGL